MKIEKTEEGYNIHFKTIIDNKLAFGKTIISKDEEYIINQFIECLKKIKENEKSNLQFFVYNRKEFMSYLLSRFILFNTEQDIIPINRYRIEDIREKLGNYNDDNIVYNYFGYDKYEQDFSSDELEDKNELALFITKAIANIKNLSKITSGIVKNTYQENFCPKIVVSLEIEPILDKKQEFKDTFTYLKDEPEDKIIRFMKNNFIFSKILSISICQLTDKEVVIKELDDKVVEELEEMKEENNL